MNPLRDHPGRVGAWIPGIALAILSLAFLDAGRDVSAVATPSSPVSHAVGGQSSIPYITVIVDSQIPYQSPTGLAINPTGTSLWLTEEIVSDGRLVRVDLVSDAVTAVATGLNQPGHLVVSGTVAYVAGNVGNPITLVQIDLDDGTVTTVSDELGGGLSGVAVNHALTQAHVVNFGNGVLSRVDIDPSSPTFKQVTQVATGLSGPRDIAINIPGTVAYVTEQHANRLVQVDINPASPGYGSITTIAGGLGGPRGLTLNQTGDRVYLAEEFGRKLSTVDVDPGSGGYGSVTTIVSEQTLRDVVLNPDEHVAYVADVDDAILKVGIDSGSPDYGKVLGRVPPVQLDGSRGLDLNADATIAYVVEEFSGDLSRVDIDPASPDLGAVSLITCGLDIPAHVMITQDEGYAYATTQRGPDRGVHSVRRVDLSTGQMITVTDALELPTGIDLDDAETYAYVTEPPFGRLSRVNLSTGATEAVASGIPDIFGVRLNPAETHAYVTTSVFSPVSPSPREFLRVDLATGQAITIAEGLVSPTGIWINASETLAYLTEFGPEGGCGGALDKVDIDPASSTYGMVTRLLTGLCGPHDVRLGADESTLYVVEVDGKRLFRVDFRHATYLPIVLRGP
jgi:DNA-binding beta-propeller fold protein YncE